MAVYGSPLRSREESGRNSRFAVHLDVAEFIQYINIRVFSAWQKETLHDTKRKYEIL